MGISEMEKRLCISVCLSTVSSCNFQTLFCTIHLLNYNVSSHDTSSIIDLNYLSPVVPDFSYLVTVTRI